MDRGNPEIKRLYDEDQNDREHWLAMQPGEWDEVRRRDTGRRKPVRELLESGALTTGEDFDRAALIFQHGSAPADYLLAHVLATSALASGI